MDSKNICKKTEYWTLFTKLLKFPISSLVNFAPHHGAPTLELNLLYKEIEIAYSVFRDSQVECQNVMDIKLRNLAYKSSSLPEHEYLVS